MNDQPFPLDPELRARLIRAAQESARSAYCRYSGFHVGAAVLAENEIFTGCNIENASFGLTVCAERVAIFSAIAAGKRSIQAICVACPDAAPDAPLSSRSPCGACRQVMREFGGPGMVVLMGDQCDTTLAELLPMAFSFQGPGSGS